MLGRLQIIILFLSLLIGQCHGQSHLQAKSELTSQGDAKPALQWNNPYPEFKPTDNTLYTAFTERPKHLDPALSYTTSEAIFTYQMYEPPLQYHYLKRPYELIPLVADSMPAIRYVDQNNVVVSSGDEKAAFSIFTIKIKPGIYYQPHPAFAKKNETNEYLYHNLSAGFLKNKHTLSDFPETGTRELIAEDFVYQIKRIADPTINSPIYGLMSNYIAGMKELSKTLQDAYQKIPQDDSIKFLDLRPFELEGAKVIDRYTYEIKINGKYPQIQYWLAMPFFAPMPYEAIKFYSQKALIKRNITLDWYPVGTGPFMLIENNPNLQMILTRNPHFHGENFPMQGEPGDKEKGYLKNAGKPLPFIDKIIFTLEKENIPYWSKFLQGYYDQSAVTSTNFDQAIKSSSTNNLEVSSELKNKNIRLSSSVLGAIFYWGFNMLDETVGGKSEKNKKLRQAIAIAMDTEEYINIFLNGTGVVAMSPLAPGIFGYEEGIKGVNKYVYNVDLQNNKYKRKTLIDAKKLMREAGYADGIDPKTKKPLMLTYDVTVTNAPDSAAQLAWIRKQFKKLGIDLVVRATDYNRFQDKMRNGDFQIYFWGWDADYPDPENFMFLLYSKNSKVKTGGENACNYSSSEFDKYFEEMKSMPNDEKRAEIISKMISIVQEDVPWFAGFHPQIHALRHQWVGLTKPNPMVRYTLKYSSIEPNIRAKFQNDWNQPIVIPLIIVLVLLILLCIPAVIVYRHKMVKAYQLKASVVLKETKE